MVLKTKQNSIFNLLRKAAALFALALPLMPWALSQTMQVPKKKKTESSHIEPSLRTMEGQLVFDKKTKDALIRGSEPGLMLAEQEIPGHVYSIRIKGAKKIEADAVILRLKTHIGAEYRPALIAEDIQEIWKMGLFSNVEVYQKKLASGAYELEYLLVEMPTIFDVKIKGNKSFSEQEIKDIIAGLENYQVARPDRLQSFAAKIKEFTLAKAIFWQKLAIHWLIPARMQLKSVKSRPLAKNMARLRLRSRQPRWRPLILWMLFLTSMKTSK